MGDRSNSLNAPSGAGCFLAGGATIALTMAGDVLMHLLVLGAFWLEGHHEHPASSGLNAPSGAGCFLAQGGRRERHVGRES